MTTNNWHRHAACRGTDPAVFFDSDTREADVQALLAAGWSCPAIAARLDVHVDSVRRLRRKLALRQEAA